MTLLNSQEYLSQLKPNNRLYKLLFEGRYGYIQHDNCISPSYNNGLNKNNLSFNPHGKSSPGGIYFIDEIQLLDYKAMDYNNVYNKVYITEVTLPEDALVYIENGKQKTNKLILLEIQPLTNILLYVKQTDELCKFVVQHQRGALKYVNNKTDEICKLAVQYDGTSLKYVPEQTEELCKLAVQQNYYALKYVIDQTDELCKLAVKNSGYYIQYVKNQTEELCKLAVQQDSYALQFIKEQTEEVCKLALQQNCHAFDFVHVQTVELCKMHVRQCNINKGFMTEEQYL
jgi:hypothetical protein